MDQPGATAVNASIHLKEPEYNMALRSTGVAKVLRIKLHLCLKPVKQQQSSGYLE